MPLSRVAKDPSTMHPFTFVACTYNLWATYDWPQRRRPLQRFLKSPRPDVRTMLIDKASP